MRPSCPSLAESRPDGCSVSGWSCTCTCMHRTLQADWLLLLGCTDMNVGYILCEDQLHRYFSRFGNVLDGAFLLRILPSYAPALQPAGHASVCWAHAACSDAVAGLLLAGLYRKSWGRLTALLVCMCMGAAASRCAVCACLCSVPPAAQERAQQGLRLHHV